MGLKARERTLLYFFLLTLITYSRFQSFLHGQSYQSGPQLSSLIYDCTVALPVNQPDYCTTLSLFKSYLLITFLNHPQLPYYKWQTDVFSICCYTLSVTYRLSTTRTEVVKRPLFALCHCAFAVRFLCNAVSLILTLFTHSLDSPHLHISHDRKW